MKYSDMQKEVGNHQGARSEFRVSPTLVVETMMHGGRLNIEFVNEQWEDDLPAYSGEINGQDELRKLLEAKSSKETIAAQILDEIELLEEDIAMRSECLKVLVAKIPTAG